MLPRYLASFLRELEHELSRVASWDQKGNGDFYWLLLWLPLTTPCQVWIFSGTPEEEVVSFYGESCE